MIFLRRYKGYWVRIKKAKYWKAWSYYCTAEKSLWNILTDDMRACCGYFALGESKEAALAEIKRDIDKEDHGVD